MRKYFLTTCIMALFAIGFASSEESEEAKERHGTYVITDVNGVTWTFALLDENQVTARKEGMSEDDMYYGHWTLFSKSCMLSFTDFHAGNPQIAFPNGTVWSDSECMELGFDGYLYKSDTYLTSKNPNGRIKWTKTN